MRIGIGLPNTVLDLGGDTLLAWARRAEARGFSALATIDRIGYPSYDSLTPLTPAAAVTERIELFPNILLAPVYNPVLLAKVTATLDQVAGGRLTLGLGVGGRPDDYALAGRSFSDRGRRFDADLELLHQAWAGRPVAGSRFPVGPATTRGRVPLLIGGQPELAAPRAARWQAGFTIGGAPPEMAGPAIQAFKEAWKRAGGDGTPRIVVLSYFSLGEAIVGYLGAVGIRTRMRPMERAAYFAAVSSKKLRGVCVCTSALYGNAAARGTPVAAIGLSGDHGNQSGARPRIQPTGRATPQNAIIWITIGERVTL